MRQYRKHKIQEKYAYRKVVGAGETLLMTVLFFWVWTNFVVDHNQTGHLTGYGNLFMALGIYLLMLLEFNHFFGGYKIGVHRKMNTLAAQVSALFVSDFLEVFVSMAITGNFRFFDEFLTRYFAMFLVQAFLICCLTGKLIDLYRHLFPPLQVLEIYDQKVTNLGSKITLGRPDKYQVASSISVDQDVSALREKMNQYDAVLVDDMPSQKRNMLIKLCFEMNKRVYFTPKLSDIIIKSSENLNLFDTPLYLNRNMGMKVSQRIIKRFFDILLSLIALIILSPVLLIVAIAIKKEDGGPVFFKQERCTLNNKTFMILKFRSMIVDAEKDGRPHPAGEEDDRITHVGKFIRKTRIDELPQLINILKGDMSIVGPRPERIEHVQLYTESIPEFSFRSKVKGGLTGYAQVYGKYNTTALDKLKMDLIYIENYSLLLDVQILFETVRVIFQKESTEGFSEAQQEHMEEMEEEHKHQFHDDK